MFEVLVILLSVSVSVVLLYLWFKFWPYVAALLILLAVFYIGSEFKKTSTPLDEASVVEEAERILRKEQGGGKQS